MPKKTRHFKRPTVGREKNKPDHNKWLVPVIYTILVVATLIAYEPLRHNELVDYDTNDYVTNNPKVNQGLNWGSVKWAFTESHAANWHPLTWLSHMLDCQLFGLNPLGHHLMSLFFHVANTLLLFWILQQMTGAIWRSSLVAALFALHPLHVESVAWVAERKDVLSGFFFMLSVVAYLRYARRPGISRYLLILLALALGLMAKPMLVTLPFVLLLLDYWPLKRLSFISLDVKKNTRQSKSTRTTAQKLKNTKEGLSIDRLILEKLPLFALAAISGIITFLVQQSGGAMKSAEQYPFLIRLSNALVSYVGYIIKMLYPRHLAVLYPHPADNLPPWQPIVCFLILAAVTIVIVYTARRRRYLAVGWLWYLGMLVPVIGLVQVGIQAMADRYTYLPLIGIFIIVAWGAAEGAAKWRYDRAVLAVAASAVLVTFLILTRFQLSHWRNTISLYEHTLAVTKNNYLIHHNLGRVFVAQNKNDEAIFHFSEALRIKEDYPKAHNNMGVMLAQQGDFDLAMEHFARAIELRPADDRAYHNMAQTLFGKGDTAGAIKYYRSSLKYKYDSYETLNNLGWILATSDEAQYRNGPEAVQLAQRACQLTEHQNPHALGTLAAAYAEVGRFSEAVETAQKAIDRHRALGQTKQAETVAAQQQLYQKEQPHRDKR